MTDNQPPPIGPLMRTLLEWTATKLQLILEDRNLISDAICITLPFIVFIFLQLWGPRSVSTPAGRPTRIRVIPPTDHSPEKRVPIIQRKFSSWDTPLYSTLLSDTTIQKMFLTKEHFRHKYLGADGKPYDKILVSAALFHPKHPLLPQLCLIKRLSTDKHHPNVFELPNGKVKPCDETIVDALIREVNEKTSFNVEQVLEELSPTIYTSCKKDGSGKEAKKRCIRLNYVILTRIYAWDKIWIDRDQYEEGIWAKSWDIRGLKMEDGMRRVVEEAWKWKEISEKDKWMAGEYDEEEKEEEEERRRKLWEEGLSSGNAIRVVDSDWEDVADSSE